MHAISGSVPTLGIAASVCGALALAGVAGKLARPHRGGRPILAQLANLGDGGWWLALAAGAGAFWLGDETMIVLFALTSMASLAGFLGIHAATVDRPPLYIVCCFLCVPLQYGLVALRSHDLFATVVPLVAALIVPLATIAQSGARITVDCMTRSCFAVVVWVYFVSHAAALFMLDIGALANVRPALVVFLVVLSFASHSLWSLVFAPGNIRARNTARASTQAQAARLFGLAAVASLGALLSPMTPFTVIGGIAMAALIAVASWTGCFVATLTSPGNPGRLNDARQRAHRADRMNVPYPHALAFAAPVFFYAVQAWSAW